METLDDIKEVAEQNIKFAYDKGYEDGLKDRIGLGWMDGYTKGLEEAWECAKKIYHMSAEKIIAIFGSCSNWVDFTAEEAIKKIKEYEEKQSWQKKSCATCHFEDVHPKHNQAPCDVCNVFHNRWIPKEPDNEIRVGDEVYFLDENYKSVVTCVADNYAVMITQIGKWSVEDVKKIHKTGKHFDEIEKVLNLLKGGTP